MKSTGEAIAVGSNKKAFEYKEGVLRIEVGGIKGASGAEAKSFYYFIKLHHLLFPEVFPDTHGAGLDESGTVNVLVDRVAHDETHAKYQELIKSGTPKDDPVWRELAGEWQQIESSPEYKSIITKVKKAGFRGEFEALNSSRDADGKRKFFDFEPAFWAGDKDDKELTVKFDPKLLRQAILKIDDKKRREWAIYCYNAILGLLPDELLDKNEKLKASFIAI
ncbi:MAG: hypothetical protein G01um10148_946 [Parcubacteria group bacterium Gr01-1014_8]|nr:MAG: hypothetical protein G01um10148_946 [Parcubacteria group bacterium Gr01-1014_8]